MTAEEKVEIGSGKGPRETVDPVLKKKDAAKETEDRLRVGEQRQGRDKTERR